MNDVCQCISLVDMQADEEMCNDMDGNYGTRLSRVEKYVESTVRDMIVKAKEQLTG